MMSFLNISGNFKKVLSVLLIVCLSFTLCACGGNKHKITVTQQHDGIVLSCPKSATAGDTIQIKTCSVCDGVVKITVNNDNLGEFTSETLYEFTMPNCDVSIYAKISTDGCSAA